MSLVRTLIWGASHVHVSDHLAAIDRHPAAVLAGVLSDDERPSVSQVAGVQAVIVNGRTGLHEEHVKWLRRFDVACFVEKPLGTTGDQARSIAETLSGTTAATGFFVHHVPAVRRWLTHVPRDGAVVSLGFGHAGRTQGLFTGEFAWMIDPAQGGSGSFADLAIHLVHLIQLAWPDQDVVPVEVRTEPAHDGLSDAGGRAIVTIGTNRAELQVSAERDLGLTARVTSDGRDWSVNGGVLHADHDVRLDGPAPDAATAVTAFLDTVAGRRSRLRPATPDEAVKAQTTLERLLPT